MNLMKRKMREFAERMESMNEVVTPEHIKELFEGLKRERQMKFNERMEEISEGKGRRNGDEDRMRDAEHWDERYDWLYRLSMEIGRDEYDWVEIDWWEGGSKTLWMEWWDGDEEWRSIPERGREGGLDREIEG